MGFIEQQSYSITNVAPSGWQPNPQWYDVKTIFNNDVQAGYTKAYIVMLTDENDTLTLSNYSGSAWKTSDGNFYSSSTTITWNRSLDKVTTLGYNLRWVIVYSTSTLAIKDGTNWFYSGSKYYYFGSSADLSGNNVFWNCYSLEAVDMSNVTNISLNNKNFIDCYGLIYLNLPNVLTTITNNLVANCYALRYMNIPTSVTSIGGYAFQYCYNLDGITIPSGCTGAFPDHGFISCTNLSAINIPSGVTSIASACFYLCSNLQTLTIPSTVTSLDYNYALIGLYKLTNLTLPSGFNLALNISTSSLMSVVSLENMIDAAASGLSVTWAIGSVNMGKLSSTYLSKASGKGITLA